MTPSGEMSGQHETTRQQSKAAWRAVAPGWYAQREELWKASRPVSEWMIRRLDPQPGDTVLELAAGLADTGLMAARLVSETGRVIITDFAPEMVSVDGVLCRWGYMLMVDPAAALAETRRVLRSGGKLAYSVFAAPERNPASSLVVEVLVRAGHIPPLDPEEPMADPGIIRELVVGAGFAEPEIEEVS